MNNRERERLRERLLQYPSVTEENVEHQLYAYEEREDLKRSLMEDRRLSNAMAEIYLDKKGYPRPPGWHSVFFYPGSSRPRNIVIIWTVLIGLAVLYFSK